MGIAVKESLHAILSRNGRMGGKIQGPLSKKNKTGIFGMTKEERVEACTKAGLLACQHPNSKAALKRMLADRQHQQYASHRANHARRGITKPNCPFCYPPADGIEL